MYNFDFHFFYGGGGIVVVEGFVVRREGEDGSLRTMIVSLCLCREGMEIGTV
jgi:hypothetical protein